MEYNFNLIEKSSFGIASINAFTFRKYGYLTQLARQNMGMPNFIKIYVDPEKKAIMFRVVPTEGENVYRVGKGNVTINREKTGLPEGTYLFTEREENDFIYVLKEN